MSNLLYVDNISVSFDGFKAINCLSFEIGFAEMRAIIGPNGAGKTTFMDIVTGKTRPDSGAVRWGDAGSSLLRKSEAQIAQLGIGRKFQKPTTFETQSVYDNLLMALSNKRSPFSVLTYARNKVDEAQISQIASQINLQESLSRLAGELSHGQKQWLEIGMLLAQDPQLLLVDEPAAGMTAPERAVTVTLLKELARTRSVIVVEHDMEFIRQLECRVTVLHEGAVLAEGSLDFVTRNQDVIDVYLGR
ncbi:MAG: urea ABC transporter ATP-binding protein UrtD [Alphaproteobacteria bacterium]|jgi:urea transport system ATP-binding protein|nr:urea ABC transporter ATP-binding protein UrtD [Alphaproteobacteria bacterium]MBT5728996.1 urea ABC transporter ATP-binding protein UrtD [Alphaproteobacteria bacterium]MDA7775630.1 urea ABC transporter ATP-binding protein UrtD [Alphaproteobacteria bacterium]MDA8881748.1 urea ABC transporter ATP-binding protein UrtD [Alphaproteobacteria bacterium]MDA8915445.1 urea ABC transporter ATP-binding protein UrtD [Alphaproteobacteria bacterium]|tara:strand:+ start:619 stop:1359 length:741 start_codon:yes stop_codon:yes gene_type:complete